MKLAKLNLGFSFRFKTSLIPSGIFKVHVTIFLWSDCPIGVLAAAMSGSFGTPSMMNFLDLNYSRDSLGVQSGWILQSFSDSLVLLIEYRLRAGKKCNTNQNVAWDLNESSKLGVRQADHWACGAHVHGGRVNVGEYCLGTGARSFCHDDRVKMKWMWDLIKEKYVLGGAATASIRKS